MFCTALCQEKKNLNRDQEWIPWQCYSSVQLWKALITTNILPLESLSVSHFSAHGEDSGINIKQHKLSSPGAREKPNPAWSNTAAGEMFCTKCKTRHSVQQSVSAGKLIWKCVLHDKPGAPILGHTSIKVCCVLGFKVAVKQHTNYRSPVGMLMTLLEQRCGSERERLLR